MIGSKISNKGFTLVELAIVIVIIGLLVGGVLTGQELIKQARIRHDVKRLSSIEAAIATFYSKYNFIPGDFPASQAQRFLNLPANRGGNGDGKLGWISGDTYFADANFVWLHLAQSNILNVTSPSGNAITNTTNSIYIRFRQDRAGERTGIMYALTGDLYHRVFSGNIYGIDNVGNAFTIAGFYNSNAVYAAYPADEARSMDEKIDDGKASTGKLKGANGRNPGDSSAAQCRDANGQYLNNESVIACRIIYEFGL